MSKSTILSIVVAVIAIIFLCCAESISSYDLMLIISILIWAVTIFLFKNSYDDWQCDYLNDSTCSEKVWREKDRLTAPLWKYILCAVSIFIPILNVVIASVTLLYLMVNYFLGTIYLHIELPEQLQKFLTKKY